MGGGAWSDKDYTDRAAHRVAKGVLAFAYSASTSRAAPADRKAHATMTALGVKVRECRDSAEHPNSNGIVIWLDVTGSMAEVPVVMQQQLPKLLGLLIRKNYITDPQILIGAVGDANSDDVPLQMGQFESDIRIEENLTNLFLEGNGGGHGRESYDLAIFSTARHTEMDCFEKRGRKGYCFIIGDERLYDCVSKSFVKDLIGDGLEADIPTEVIIKELQEKYNVYFIIPSMTSGFAGHHADSALVKHWQGFLGQNVLELSTPETICELIAGVIGLSEGTVDQDELAAHFADVGAGATAITAVTTELSKVTPGTGIAKMKGSEVAIGSSGAASGVTTI